VVASRFIESLPGFTTLESRMTQGCGCHVQLEAAIERGSYAHCTQAHPHESPLDRSAPDEAAWDEVTSVVSRASRLRADNLPETRIVVHRSREAVVAAFAAAAQGKGQTQEHLVAAFRGPQRQDKGRIASTGMLPNNLTAITGAASPNRIGGAHGGEDQHGCATRGTGCGGGALLGGAATP
jgi:hypothetical protein